MFHLRITTAKRGVETTEPKGDYRTLKEAIEAAIKSNLDLAKAVIERNGDLYSVRDWIRLNAAGACLRERFKVERIAA